MAESPNILHLYTLYFPQGKYEAFIESELPYLAEAFDEVKIFPYRKVDKDFRTLPVNVSVVFSDNDLVKVGPIPRLVLMGKNLLKRSFLKNFRYQYGNAGKLLARKNRMKGILERSEKAIHYSYWFDEWATILGLLAKEEVLSKYVSRVHGFDLYDNRQVIGYHPHRAIQLNGLSKLYSVSNLGAEYLKKRLPSAPIVSAYLGTEDYGIGPIPKDDCVQVLSVAKVIPLKRLDCILKSLMLCKKRVHWTHVGSGGGLEALKTQSESLPSNVTVDFKGAMKHRKVMELFQQHGFHFLISLSETEGLPVSMMEAISFGVPILSTDVGGVNELVNDKSGELVPARLNYSSVADQIDNWILSGRSKPEYRESLREFWKQHFAADRNYPRFTKEIKALCTK